MAYSGLGAGTQADPYQITTVSQFKEMNNAAYAGVHFLLMNDLDFAAETSVVIDNFYCKFDGGDKKLANYPSSGSYTWLQNNSEFTNVEINYSKPTSTSGGVVFYGGNNTKSGVVIRRVIIRNFVREDELAQVIFQVAKYDNTCVIEDFTAEGNFKSSIFSYVNCSVSRVRIFNSNTGVCPLFLDGGIALVLNDFEYHKPITITAGASGSFIGSTYKGCVCRRGVIRLGVVEAPICPIFAAFNFENYKSFTYEDIAIYANKITFTDALKSYILFTGTVGAYSTVNISRIAYLGNFETPGQTSRVSVFAATTGKVFSSYFSKDRMITTAPDTAQEKGLTELQISQPSSYLGWDFLNTWGIVGGEPKPVTSIVQVPLITPVLCAIINYPVRAGGGQFTIKAASSADDSVSLVIKIDGETQRIQDLQFNDYKSEVSVVFSLENDTLFTIELESKETGLEGFVLASEVFLYYVNDSAVEIYEDQAVSYAVLTDGVNRGVLIHGTVLVGDYVYGSARNRNPATENGCVVKASLADVTDFLLIPISTETGGYALDMDSLVCIGQYLYTLFSIGTIAGLKRLLKYDTLNDTYQTYNIGDLATLLGAPSCEDGVFLYVYVGGNKIWKIDVSQFNSTEQYNTEIWQFNKTEIALVCHYGDYTPHTMVVDSEYLYVGFGTGSIYSQYEIQKIRKSDMVLVSYAEVPKMTDDMCQTDTHLFIGVELLPGAQSTAYGYGWGACAIRKSDMTVTALPKLHKTDTVSTNSYASLVFGEYLIDLKTNGYIYALDISSPDTWSLSENVASRTLKTYDIQMPDGSADIPGPINEILLSESGIFVGFVWNNIPSAIASFDLPGLNYFSAPTVATIDAAIVGDNDVSLAGFITNTGGKTVTAVGIILGQAADLSDGVDYPVTPVSTEFEKAFNDLEYGTYYFRTYATNAEGTGYGEIKSFTLEIPYTEPGQPTALDKAIQAEITINWTAPIDDGGTPITGYKIERKSSDGDWAVIVANTGDTETSYTETLPQGAYQYRVSAITDYATSQPSATLDVNAVVGGVGKYRIFLGSTEITTVE